MNLVLYKKSLTHYNQINFKKGHTHNVHKIKVFPVFKFLWGGQSSILENSAFILLKWTACRMFWHKGMFLDKFDNYFMVLHCM